MERPKLVPQLYGYVVCLVCVITMLIASAGLIDGFFDAAVPQMSREVDHQSRTFEQYKQSRIERLNARKTGVAPVTAEALPADDVLRRSYEEERAYQISRARYQGLRKMVTSILVLLLATGFFFAHWRWLRSFARVETA